MRIPPSTRSRARLPAPSPVAPLRPVGTVGQQENIRQARIEDAEAKRNALEAEILEERKEASKGWFGLF